MDRKAVPVHESAGVDRVRLTVADGLLVRLEHLTESETLRCLGGIEVISRNYLADLPRRGRDQRLVELGAGDR